MSWRIVPQVEKQGKEEREVLCKAVRYCPIKDKQTGETHFLRLKSVILKVIICHEESGAEHSITWSNRAHKSLDDPNCGKFKYKWGGQVEDDDFVVHDRFWKWMAKHRPEVAHDVQIAFLERLLEAAA
jgi:hypothetical protein